MRMEVQKLEKTKLEKLEKTKEKTKMLEKTKLEKTVLEKTVLEKTVLMLLAQAWLQEMACKPSQRVIEQDLENHSSASRLQVENSKKAEEAAGDDDDEDGASADLAEPEFIEVTIASCCFQVSSM